MLASKAQLCCLQPVVLSTPTSAKRIKVERKTRSSTNQRRAIILDVDMSVDCVQGVMLAVTRPDVDIQAVTCVSGVVNIEHTCNNALRVLKACNREDVRERLLMLLFTDLCTLMTVLKCTFVSYNKCKIWLCLLGEGESSLINSGFSFVSYNLPMNLKSVFFTLFCVELQATYES